MPAALAAKAATTTIPIVFASPTTRSGWSCCQPGSAGRQPDGHQFLQSTELVAKRLELLRELVPASHSCCRARQSSQSRAFRDHVARDGSGCAAIGLQVQVLNASTSSEIDAAFATLRARARRRASSSAADALFHQPACPIGQPGGAPRDPGDLLRREFAEAGGLMSYGTSLYATRIVRSASTPAASSRARSLPTCRSCSRPSSSWSSTSRPPRRSASTCRRRCSPAPTR